MIHRGLRLQVQLVSCMRDTDKAAYSILCLTCSCFVMIGPKKRLQPARHKTGQVRKNREDIKNRVCFSADCRKMRQIGKRLPSASNIMRSRSQVWSGEKDANLLLPPYNCLISNFLMEWKVNGSISTFAITSLDYLRT